MERVVAYIDAYNLYHSLKEKGWQRFYWLDIPLLIQELLKNEQNLERIYYFTSPSLNNYSRKRQMTFVEALAITAFKRGIDFRVINGRFESEDVRCEICNDYALCNGCNQPIIFSHEKETDVNISVQLLSDAYEDSFDTALLLTEDSDQVGTIKTIKKYFSHSKLIGIIFPPGRKSDHLIKVADFYLHISQNDVAKNQLPDVIYKSNTIKLNRPNEWK
jgi:uncharacterized LabA/DUF88 family protein